MSCFIKHACDPVCIFRSLTVALVIGTMHALLNHFDAMMDGTLNLMNVAQMLVTYIIPYSVATHGSVMQALHMEKKKGEEAACPDLGDDKPEPPSPTMKTRLKLFAKYARDRVCVLRAIKVALVIGSIIGLINHLDEIVSGTLTGTNILQIGLTYLIPFSVSTYGSAMQACHVELQEKETGRDS